MSCPQGSKAHLPSMPLANFWGRESHLLPQLNDAAACSDKGLFLYLPVKKDEEQLKAGCVTFGSIVSRLIFIPHMWSEAEKAVYLSKERHALCEMLSLVV